jgi:hypothetical protein
MKVYIKPFSNKNIVLKDDFERDLQAIFTSDYLKIIFTS